MTAMLLYMNNSLRPSTVVMFVALQVVTKLHVSIHCILAQGCVSSSIMYKVVGLCTLLCVVRWKRDKNNVIVIDKDTKKPILQFVAIVRRDHGDWAIPGVSKLYS